MSFCFSPTINFVWKWGLQAAIRFRSYLNSGVKVESINDLSGLDSLSVSRCQLSKHQGDSRGQYLVFIRLLRAVCKDNRSLSVRIWSEHCALVMGQSGITPRGCHYDHRCPPCPLSRIWLDLGSLSLRSLTQKLASAHTTPRHPVPVHLCFPPSAELTSPESQH